MNLTQEELNQIINTLGIELPRESLEEHLIRVYGTRLDAAQVLNDIESGRLSICPDISCREILSSREQYAHECDYAFYFRTNNLMDCEHLETIAERFALFDNENDFCNLGNLRLAKTIRDNLVRIAIDTMRETAQEVGDSATDWYNEHSAILSFLAFDFVENWVFHGTLFSENHSRSGFIDRFRTPLLRRLEIEGIIFGNNQNNQ